MHKILSNSFKSEKFVIKKSLRSYNYFPEGKESALFLPWEKEKHSQPKERQAVSPRVTKAVAERIKTQ